MKVAGLNIENSHAGVSIVSSVLGMTRALKAEEIRLPDTEELRAGALRESLLKWKADYGITGVVFGLDFKDFTHHFIELPLKSKRDIERALAFELEKHLPLPEDEYIYDFHILSSKKNGSEILLMSVRKDRLRWLTECLKDTGLKLLGVKCSMIEAVNEFISSGRGKDSALIYPSARPSGRYYYIAGLRGAAPAYFKTVSENNLQPELERLREAFPMGAYAAGTGAHEIPDTKALPFSIPNLIALSVLKKNAIDIDFFPEELATPKTDYYPYAAGIMTALSVLIFISTGVYSFYKDYAALKSVDGRIENIQQTARGLVETKKALEAVEEKTRFLTEFKMHSNTGIRALRELSAVLPEDIWLAEFSSDKTGTVEIRGLAKRAAKAIEPLEKSAVFKNVRFSSPVTQRENLQRFSLKMEIEE
ncbi:MAG: PilN domain-containing protein [Thermodesulfovibrionales bacterium]|nr:PilN domain-containing protein [Thermodesulfovibrionales bacterium]